jgi:cytoskeleton protein RodZ
MPDIGSNLREARMRARIDISEIESETKIRAKYLRALENEEWDLLPGPTYVKSFLRTYADALGLDGKLLIEEYKLRHERLSDVELRPIAPPGSRERRRRPRPVVSRGAIVAVVVVALLVALYFIGSGGGGDDNGSLSTSTGRTTPKSAASATGSKKKKAGHGAGATGTHHKAKQKPKRARLTIVATGQVYVCLKAAGNRTPVNGVILTSGAHSGPFRSSRFRLQLGNGEARLFANGKTHTVPAVTNGIGYEITPTAMRRVSQARWPRCHA